VSARTWGFKSPSPTANFGVSRHARSWRAAPLRNGPGRTLRLLGLRVGRRADLAMSASARLVELPDRSGSR